MATNDPALLDRIMSFDIDGGPATLGFDRRLARECNWPLNYARRVIGEYRRFLYLAMTAGHPVTPSDEVDQAWHLHLVYTRSYWERLCRDVLPRPLHHEPTRGGRSESAKFDDWYARTLESYAAAFGAAPPADIWPAAQQRFDSGRRFERVRKADCWIVRKPRLRSVLPAAALILLSPLAVGLLAAGEGGVACGLFALAAAVILFVGLFARSVSAAGPAGRKDGRDGGSSCGAACGTGSGGRSHGGLWGAGTTASQGPADVSPDPGGPHRTPAPGRLDVHDVEGGESSEAGAGDAGGGDGVAGDGGAGDGGSGCGSGCGGGCGG
ncbi:MAG: hypothetical protein AMXMBFR47_37960 [Planctomycetota bacterium]